MDHYYFLLRLLICFLLSFCIGLERELRGSSAGLRANIIVCLGSFLFVSASFNSYDDDMMRIPAQVISGIGFLGAGSIMINDNKIRGLNTAATMWCVAAIGVLTGLKLIFEAVSGTIAIIFTNLFIRKIKKTIKIGRHIDDDL
ncbi:MAG: MgtC/SapB family protein [Erysipelotrichaceae bacterium]|nr:MgtC/SapB family protein [Erysipelotrichaceae bacterium]